MLTSMMKASFSLSSGKKPEKCFTTSARTPATHTRPSVPSTYHPETLSRPIHRSYRACMAVDGSLCLHDVCLNSLRGTSSAKKPGLAPRICFP